MDKHSALLIVDVQNDFCPGGALAVAQGDQIIPAVNRAITSFSSQGLPIIASRDWHPEKTSHFRDYGGIWPPHCIQATAGAAFHPALKLPPNALILSKGTEADHDDYSAFHARDDQGRMLAEILADLGVNALYVCGLATDYCVKETVREAQRYRVAVTVLTDAIKGVDLKPGDSEKAVHEMMASGAKLATAADLPE
ncbi:bifunctional nicotinamidase/pyrazinamidase [Geobacter pelophilus]|uniref:nicotinamidase n=1 Tax=Geoanaerobacter pelophilus TaxID=60036 RepID=A0AAW4L6Q5_9BACT|nr:bifunctional nicotinamidase/pyrazinamidase [Geoanaerobacter pelophilus]MBT0662936.1 bifunctional nicotinamidase/pyrazinamidase [Geoanaerobacter pelophilus]